MYLPNPHFWYKKWYLCQESAIVRPFTLSTLHLK